VILRLENIISNQTGIWLILDIFAEAIRYGPGCPEKYYIMIQRIQSLYLLLTSGISALFLSGDFLCFINDSGAEIIMNYRGLWMNGPGEATLIRESQLIIPIIGLLLIILPLIAIFLYRKRQQQIKLAVASTILSAVLVAIVAWCAYSIARDYQAVLSPVFRTFLPLIMLFLSILAWLGIRKDEKLVRSYERLR